MQGDLWRIYDICAQIMLDLFYIAHLLSVSEVLGVIISMGDHLCHGYYCMSSEDVDLRVTPSSVV